MNPEQPASSLPADKRPAGRPSGGATAFLLLVTALAFLPWLVSTTVAGFSTTGWAWMIALVAGTAIILKRHTREIVFPLRHWTAWLVLLGSYWVFAGRHPSSLQTLVQITTPLVVGCAASASSYTRAQIDRICAWLPRLVLVVFAVLLIRHPSICLGRLPAHGMLTPEAITCSLLAAIYAAFFGVGGNLRLLLCYATMLLFCVVMMTRGPLMACAAALPLSLSRMKLSWRVFLGGLLVILGLSIFNSPRYQRLLFVSGQGTLDEVRWDNANLLTSGRKPLWELLWSSWQEAPWTGKGLNASRTVLLENGYSIYLPHNDWLKLLHDFGIIGMTCFALSILFQIHGLLRLARTTRGNIQMLAYAAASGFVPFVVVMFTDNVTLYVQYYSNVHFALIGLVYGTLREHPCVAKPRIGGYLGSDARHKAAGSGQLRAP